MSKAAIIFALCGVLFPLSACAQTEARRAACQDISFQQASYTVCEFNANAGSLRLYLRDVDGIPYGNFTKLANALKSEGQKLIFAMNGGMYHQDRSPAGLYVEDSTQIQKINTNKGPGNFHLLPNGVMTISDAGAVSVVESQAYTRTDMETRFATQSGPMLVIDGKLHPKFDANSTSLNIRNGIGVNGSAVYFAISNEKVNFYSFASLFKDHLKTPNALFLDGAVSKLYAPELGRNDSGAPMGPIIAVTKKAH